MQALPGQPSPIMAAVSIVAPRCARWPRVGDLAPSRSAAFSLQHLAGVLAACLRFGLAATGGASGAAADGALCGPLCAVAGGWADRHVGNWVAVRAFDVVDNVD